MAAFSLNMYNFFEGWTGAGTQQNMPFIFQLISYYFNIFLKKKNSWRHAIWKSCHYYSHLVHYVFTLQCAGFVYSEISSTHVQGFLLNNVHSNIYQCFQNILANHEYINSVSLSHQLWILRTLWQLIINMSV